MQEVQKVEEVFVSQVVSRSRWPGMWTVGQRSMMAEAASIAANWRDAVVTGPNVACFAP